ncbi:MAG TPA: AraC family transcriptional regulator [Polyangiaceae bacterium]|nr:AraC family transcriptional regulator [Polyangiaceae bacterium]
MPSRELANTYDEVTRILGGTSPPLTPDVLSGGTRVTGRWRNPPFEGYVPPLNDHCVVCHVAGSSPGWVKMDGKFSRAVMAPGTISLVPQGQDSWRHSGAMMEVTNVYLGADCLQACADEVAHCQRPELIDRMGFEDPKLFAILALIGDEADSRAPRSRLFLEQLIDLLCIQLLRAHSSVSAAAHPLARRGLAVWQVKRITSYMSENLAADVTLGELANLVGLSRFHFCHAFRLATGCRPHQWLTRLRMDRARALLRTRELRIIDVALAVGYETQSAFAAVFRKSTGLTPSAYRRTL